jgi:hypothetical protein
MATTTPPTAILGTLVDFTSRENWDKFFALRGTGDSFEWYAEWPNLRAPLLDLLGDRGAAAGAAQEILVPACGSSVLSEKLYDAGFCRVTNVDFSRVVVADMLRRHARARPEMRWRVMDMTDMQVLSMFCRLRCMGWVSLCRPCILGLPAMQLLVTGIILIWDIGGLVVVVVKFVC